MRNFAILLSLWVCTGCTLPPYEVGPAPTGNNRVVVFDIDGTLTTRVHAIRSTREGAVAAVQAYADAGYRILYLSARHPLFQWHIPIWLDKHDFPAGDIQVIQSRQPHGNHASFKHGVLDEYRVQGWRLVAAYGDSSTDFEAYARAGIETEHVFALQREGDRACEAGAWAKCFENWPEQMDIIGELINAGQ